MSIIYINMDIVKLIYVFLLLIWSGFFIVLLFTIIREWFFPEPKFFEQFEDENDFVLPPKCVSLDVERLEKMHGLEAFAAHNMTMDTVPLLPI